MDENEKKDVLYIVIPAYDEEENIESIIKSWYEVFNVCDKSEKSKFVIINDGSKDRTFERANNLKKDFPLLEVLDKKNEGHGPTLLYGYRYAITNKADFVFQTDSDGQTNPEEFYDFWKDRYKYDIQIGNRVVRGDGYIRKVVEKVVCLLLKIYFGVSVKDANAPFRLMKMSILEKYIDRFRDDYIIPNIMLTAFFAYYKENMIYKTITFKSRQGGKNSINLTKIFKIGLKAMDDFSLFKKEM